MMMKKTVKVILLAVLGLLMLVALVGCNGSRNHGDLEGKYVSESGKYTIEFKKDNTCIWFEDFFGSQYFFEGTYEKDGDNFRLLIK